MLSSSRKLFGLSQTIVLSMVLLIAIWKVSEAKERSMFFMNGRYGRVDPNVRRLFVNNLRKERSDSNNEQQSTTGKTFPYDCRLNSNGQLILCTEMIEEQN